MRARRLHQLGGCLAAAAVLAGVAAGLRAASKDREFTQDERQWWSLQKIVAGKPPAVKHAQWVRTPIDAFIVARLEARQLAPVQQADRVTLVRRAYGGSRSGWRAAASRTDRRSARPTRSE